ncbi:hypothetical protein COT51_01830 [candidate division WWE3 bacterium CG08_land_8_20_14_0_20_41_15]|uniref:Uncharacterized protein n=1 Tax=candidate division WWE3 bacterium CG08_land_8_20_14_0_20_41_15 TaxID=1975086 RepID=A0A2H0X9L7_UNCKA|nr:MAG: hypothetical protein COT51_01830 [candidate division WWE3 bacterium CG08_land_8_20_14_0_20_41_15]
MSRELLIVLKASLKFLWVYHQLLFEFGSLLYVLLFIISLFSSSNLLNQFRNTCFSPRVFI